MLPLPAISAVGGRGDHSVLQGTAEPGVRRRIMIEQPEKQPQNLTGGTVTPAPNATATAPIATPAKARIVAVDVTRGIALLGMLAANVFDPSNSDGTPSIAMMTVVGRSATLFAFVAGLTLALLTGGRHPVQGPARKAAMAGLAARALLIGAIGLALGNVDASSGNVGVILAYYGMFFLLAIPLIGLKPRTLACIAAALIVVAPLAQLVAFRLGIPEPFPSDPTLSSPFTNPIGLAVQLFVTGHFPAIVYLIYISAGLAVGRLNLSSTKVAVRLLVGGAVLAVAAWEASWVLLFPLGGVHHLQAAADPGTTAQMTNQIVWDPDQVGSWWWLALRAHHTGTAFDAMHTLGVAMAILGAVMLATKARIVRRLLWPVAIAGSMTLTIYSAHVFVLNSPLWNDNDYAVYGGLVAGALAFAVIWHRFVMAQGPLERMVAIGSGRARSAVGKRLTRAPGEPGPSLAAGTRLVPHDLTRVPAPATTRTVRRPHCRIPRAWHTKDQHCAALEPPTDGGEVFLIRPYGEGAVGLPCDVRRQLAGRDRQHHGTR